MENEGLTIKEKGSLRLLLVRTIVTNICEDHLFDNISFDLKTELQKTLTSNLTFNTKVSDINYKLDNAYGKVTFNDEKGDNHSIDFAIGKISEIVQVD